ncbi:MAG: chemotaxis protein CheW [Chloroflexota bacterium]
MPASKPQRQIDWETVWKSLNWDDDQRQQVANEERLRQRAQHYAAPARDQNDVLEDVRAVLAFNLGGENYGVDVRYVFGIRALGTVAHVPGTPLFYQGVINVRGRILTVFDLRGFFQIPHASDDGVPAEVVIVHAGKLEMAILAHQVIGVQSIPVSTIKPIEHMPYTLGLTSEKIILLDIAQLFQDERLIVGGVNE